SGLLSGDFDKGSIDALSAKNELKAYPNPTSGPVVFEFRIGENAKATLDITSITGQLIARVFNANVEAGIPQNVICNESLAPGVYLYILRWNGQTIIGKLIITQ
ncbi:MAG: T9SS type A sorting domain-containing protein, partial [Mariniphaga sp.]